MTHYSVGDYVVYCKHKASPHPGPRAHDVRPSDHGEDYSYLVNKYWIVTAVHPDEGIEVQTRTGKLHYLKPNDPNLRHANLLEEWFYRNRFPSLTNRHSLRSRCSVRCLSASGRRQNDCQSSHKYCRPTLCVGAPLILTIFRRHIVSA